MTQAMLQDISPVAQVTPQGISPVAPVMLLGISLMAQSNVFLQNSLKVLSC